MLPEQFVEPFKLAIHFDDDVRSLCVKCVGLGERW